MWPRTLQARLVLLVSATLALVVAVIGAVTIAMQNDALLNRLDEELRLSLNMSSRPEPQRPLPEPPQGGQASDFGPRKFGSLQVLMLADTVLTAEVITSEGQAAALSEAALDTLLEEAASATLQPKDVRLSKFGDYRILASSVVSGGEAGVMIVGQSLEEVRATTRYLIGIFTLAAIAGVGIASVLGALLVRKTLAPLQSLRATAARVSDTPLASGYVQFPERPGADGTGAGSEVQDLASSFNQMLDHVEAALVEREASETKLRQFAADASHELRTPLASISGYAQLASREGDSLSETVGTSLERIQSESRRMGTIVEDLLLLARLDAGREESGAEALVAPVVLECLSNAQAAGPDKIWGADIAPDAAELKARISPAALHHSVSNLLANARRHTPAGTRVTVAVQCLDDDVVSITVEDSGPGIAPDLASRVFDRFVTGDAARSPAGDGNNEGHPVRNSGLGLAIAHELVRAASGTLTVDSIPGRTVFEIRLKRAQFSPE